MTATGSTFRILVGVKRVVDYAVRVRFKAAGTSGKAFNGGIEYGNVKHSMNPFDEIAVEEALRLKTRVSEESQGKLQAEVVVASMGPAAAVETLRTALAMGADRAIHVPYDSAEAPSVEIQNHLQPLAVAKILHALVQKEQPSVVLLGKQAIDDDANQTGQMLAGLSDLPQATFASKVELNVAANRCTVTREVDGGLERVECQLPVVVTADLRLNEPRYATLPNIMKAKSKPLQTVSMDDLGLKESIAAIQGRLRYLSVTEPPKRKAGVKVATVDELIDRLRNEAGVL